MALTNGHSNGHSVSHGTNTGLVAFVTGTSSGNGRSIALAFAETGASVICADLRAENPAGDLPTHKAISNAGGRSIFLPLDVTKDEDWQEGVAAALKEFGRVDVLVNNAGILGAQARLHEMPYKQWRLTVDINLMGPYLGMKHILPIMLQQEPVRGYARGKIVNIASNGASYGVPKSSAYTASKAGVVGLTKQTAVDYSRDGICINSVSPGLIATPMSHGFLSDKVISDHFEATTPCGRVGSPSDVAGAVLYLSSPAADYCCGTDLVIDGGYLCT